MPRYISSTWYDRYCGCCWPWFQLTWQLQDDEKIIVESRVRFLSFLGIGRQVENCGFIVHTANDVYIAHVLCCHPSSGAICKTIEAACKVSLKKALAILSTDWISICGNLFLQLRYQKCLDAHGALRGRITSSSSAAQTPTGRSLESLSATLKSVFGSISLGSKKTAKASGDSWTSTSSTLALPLPAPNSIVLF